MSKKARKNAQEHRRSEKRSRKAATQLFWQSCAGKSENKKKKTGGSHKGLGMTKHMHIGGNCTNIGCLKCSQTARLSLIKMRLATHGYNEALKVATRYGIELATD